MFGISDKQVIFDLKVLTFFPPFHNSRTLLWIGTVRSCSSPPGLGPSLALQNSRIPNRNTFVVQQRWRIISSRDNICSKSQLSL